MFLFRWIRGIIDSFLDLTAKLLVCYLMVTFASTIYGIIEGAAGGCDPDREPDHYFESRIDYVLPLKDYSSARLRTFFRRNPEYCPKAVIGWFADPIYMEEEKRKSKG